MKPVIVDVISIAERPHSGPMTEQSEDIPWHLAWPPSGKPSNRAGCSCLRLRGPSGRQSRAYPGSGVGAHHDREQLSSFDFHRDVIDQEFGSLLRRDRVAEALIRQEGSYGGRGSVRLHRESRDGQGEGGTTEGS